MILSATEAQDLLDRAIEDAVMLQHNIDPDAAVRIETNLRCIKSYVERQRQEQVEALASAARSHGRTIH